MGSAHEIGYYHRRLYLTGIIVSSILVVKSADPANILGIFPLWVFYFFSHNGTTGLFAFAIVMLLHTVEKSYRLLVSRTPSVMRILFLFTFVMAVVGNEIVVSMLGFTSSVAYILAPVLVVDNVAYLTILFLFTFAAVDIIRQIQASNKEMLKLGLIDAFRHHERPLARAHNKLVRSLIFMWVFGVIVTVLTILFVRNYFLHPFDATSPERNTNFAANFVTFDIVQVSFTAFALWYGWMPLDHLCGKTHTASSSNSAITITIQSTDGEVGKARANTLFSPPTPKTITPHHSPQPSQANLNLMLASPETSSAV